MVFYTCSGCGESLKKNKVDKHCYTCRNCVYLTCIDCNEDFYGDNYKFHTSCMTENEKYSAKGTEFKPNKGDVKQQQWLQNIETVMSSSSKLSVKAKGLLSDLKNYDNIPRKRPKFLNFLKNSLRIYDSKLGEEVWEAFSSASKENGEKKPNPAQNVAKNDNIKPENNKDTKPNGICESTELENEEKQAKNPKIEEKQNEDVTNTAEAAILKKKPKKKAKEKTSETAGDGSAEAQKKKSKKRKGIPEQDSDDSATVSKKKLKTTEKEKQPADPEPVKQNGNAKSSNDDLAESGATQNKLKKSKKEKKKVTFKIEDVKSEDSDERKIKKKVKKNKGKLAKEDDENLSTSKSDIKELSIDHSEMNGVGPEKNHSKSPKVKNKKQRKSEEKDGNLNETEKRNDNQDNTENLKPKKKKRKAEQTQVEADSSANEAAKNAENLATDNCPITEGKIKKKKKAKKFGQKPDSVTSMGETEEEAPIDADLAANGDNENGKVADSKVKKKKKVKKADQKSALVASVNGMKTNPDDTVHAQTVKKIKKSKKRKLENC